MGAVAALRTCSVRLVRLLCAWMDERRIISRKRVENYVDHLLDGAFRRIYSKPRPRVSHPSRLHQLANPLLHRHARLRQHRAHFDTARDSSCNHVRARTEADYNATIVECRIIPGVNDCTAAGSDDRRPPLAALRAAFAVRCDFRNDAAFEGAEMCLATVAKDLMNRLSSPCTYLSIAVDEGPLQPAGQMARDCAFAGGHEACEDQLHFSIDCLLTADC